MRIQAQSGPGEGRYLRAVPAAKTATTTATTGTKVAHIATTGAVLWVAFNVVGVVASFIAGPSGSVASLVIIQ